MSLAAVGAAGLKHWTVRLRNRLEELARTTRDSEVAAVLAAASSALSSGALSGAEVDVGSSVDDVAAAAAAAASEMGPQVGGATAAELLRTFPTCWQ